VGRTSLTKTEKNGPGWIETTATVVACEYQFARMNTLLLGVQTHEKFRIAFDYHAHGQTYSDEFQSPVAIAQNERFPVRYNPMKPQENDRSRNSEASGRVPLFALGMAGSILLSLFWLATMHGCN
jgi:hypothetical protein